MELLLLRETFTADSTIGSLSIDGTFECYVLEDVVRAPGEKVKSKTAIPFGRYKVVLSLSNRFQKVLPELLDVPMFVGIRIHSGNGSGDTEGCLLVGQTRAANFVGASVKAMGVLMPKLTAASKRKEDIWITIT